MRPLTTQPGRRRSFVRALGSRVPAASALSALRRLHRDQHGSISLASVFGLLLLVMLLGLVINSSRQFDHKVRMQNAADASTYAGGVVISRTINSLAFTNHMISEVMALVAFLREADPTQQRPADYTPEILDEWEKLGPIFAKSEFRKFADLGGAIPAKVDYERELIRTFDVWAAAVSADMLPVMEEILAGERIPLYQRALVESTPGVAQQVVREVAGRHGDRWPRSPQARLTAVLWRTDGAAVVDPQALPVTDPMLEPGRYRDDAVPPRDMRAHMYLQQWNDRLLVHLDEHAKMSRFSQLWRTFTCAQLHEVRSENEMRNWPHLMRTPVGRIADFTQHQQEQFMYAAVVYRRQPTNIMPGLYRNPVRSDVLAYAQTHIFAPRQKLRWGPRWHRRLGRCIWDVAREDRVCDVSHWPDYPFHWTLWNQNWTNQLVPATAPALISILSSPVNAGDGSPAVADLRDLTPQEFHLLSHH